jgi:uncharacterized protein YfaT (DUF1175 family)
MLLSAQPARLAADGFSSASLSLTSGGKPVRGATFSIVEGRRLARIEGSRLIAGVLPGAVVVEARATGYVPARVRLRTDPVLSDRAGDGTPDFMRLDSDADRAAFVQWFTFLAEAQFFRPHGRENREVNDCAALVRFAYREALREHDGAWASGLELPVVPAASSVRKYHFPFTPLGASLFRISPGAFTAADLAGGAFAEFADAQTLVRRNAHFITRDVRLAEPGDLLFFRQLDQSMPYHVMVFLGASLFEHGPGDFVVYHTGPTGHSPGEVRRPLLDELLRHPLPQWRPWIGNNNFLGVYRWNILRGTP